MHDRVCYDGHLITSNPIVMSANLRATWRCCFLTCFYSLLINDIISSTKRRRPVKVLKDDDLGLQGEPVSVEPVTQVEPVSSDTINYDLRATAILRQLQTLSSNQTNSSDDTMKSCSNVFKSRVIPTPMCIQ